MAEGFDRVWTATVAGVGGYVAAVALAGGLALHWLEPTLPACDVAVVMISAVTQGGLLPVPFAALCTKGRAVVLVSVVATSVLLTDHLVPLAAAAVRLHRRAATRTLSDTSATNAPATNNLKEAAAALRQLAHTVVAYHVCVQVAAAVAFTVCAGLCPAVQAHIAANGQGVVAWSVLRAVAAYHQVPFLVDPDPVRVLEDTSTDTGSPARLDGATLAVTAVVVLLGQVLAPVALTLAVRWRAGALGGRCCRLRLVLRHAPQWAPWLLSGPRLVLASVLVIVAWAVHLLLLLAVGAGTGGALWAASGATTARDVGLAAAFSAVAVRTAGLTAVALPALPVVGQLGYIVSMAAGAWPRTLVARLPRIALLDGRGETATRSATEGGTKQESRQPSPLVTVVERTHSTDRRAGEASGAARPPPTHRRVLACAMRLGRAARLLGVQDVPWLALALGIMAACEGGASHSALSLAFDVASAYGLVGLTLGTPTGVIGGTASTKAVLMLVMLLGRVRAFPLAPRVIL
jgi:hypothetical protein